MTQLPFYDGTNAEFVFDQIAKVLIDTGGRSIKLRFGTVACHYSTSAVSDVTTVSHGLGSTPVAVLLTGQDTGAAVTSYALNSAPSTTQFTFIGRDVQGLARGPGTLTVYWLAIG